MRLYPGFVPRALFVQVRLSVYSHLVYRLILSRIPQGVNMSRIGYLWAKILALPGLFGLFDKHQHQRKPHAGQKGQDGMLLLVLPCFRQQVGGRDIDQNT